MKKEFATCGNFSTWRYCKHLWIWITKSVLNNWMLYFAAAQMWCLAIHLPLLIGHMIPFEDAHWNLFAKMLEITSICFSPEVSVDQLAYLKISIEDHHHEFTRLYPNCSVIPKMHFMIHMPTMMIQYVMFSTEVCRNVYNWGS